MAWFNPFTRDVVDLTLDDLSDAVDDHAPRLSMIERSRESIGMTLDRCREQERQLVAEIEQLTERLRQTRLAIEAFEAAEKIIIDGDPKFANETPKKPRMREIASKKNGETE